MPVTLTFSNPTATTLDAFIFNAQDLVYNRDTEAYETPDDLNVADYAFETASAGYGDTYEVLTPPAFAAGFYYIEVRERVSGSPSLAGNRRFAGPFQVDEFGDEVLVGTVQGVTLSAAQVAAILEGTTLRAQRGDTITADFTGLGNISTRTKLWFTVKRRPADEADADALAQIEETLGLLYLNGAAATAGQGSVVVTNPATGALTVTLAAAATASLDPGRYRYDLQMLTPSGVRTLTFGEFVVTADVTRSVS